MLLNKIAIVCLSSLFLCACEGKKVEANTLINISISRTNLADMVVTLTNIGPFVINSISDNLSGVPHVSLLGASSTCQNISDVNPLGVGQSCTLTYENAQANDPESTTGSLTLTWNYGSGSASKTLTVTSATYLYAGGTFTSTYNGSANALNYIAQWDGSQWTALGPSNTPGLDNAVQALIVFNNLLYVGGNFDTTYNGSANTLNYIAQWDGNSWRALGSPNPGFNGTVRSLTIFNNALYAGGLFDTTYQGTANALDYIALWSSNAWSALGSPAGLNNSVSVLQTFNNKLYAGGFFTTTHGGSANALNFIASWDGSNWGALGSSNPGLNATPSALFVFNNKLYAGGGFTTTYQGTANALNHIASWDGSNWGALGSPNPGLNALVDSLTASNNKLYVGGDFDSTYNGSANTLNNIAGWDGSNWSALGTPSGLNAPANALAVAAYLNID